MYGFFKKNCYEYSLFINTDPHGRRASDEAHLASAALGWQDLKCFFRDALVKNDFEQCVHLKSRMPACRFRCTFKSPAMKNDLLHCVQMCGLIPV